MPFKSSYLLTHSKALRSRLQGLNCLVIVAANRAASFSCKSGLWGLILNAAILCDGRQLFVAAKPKICRCKVDFVFVKLLSFFSLFLCSFLFQLQKKHCCCKVQECSHKHTLIHTDLTWKRRIVISATRKICQRPWKTGMCGNTT